MIIEKTEKSELLRSVQVLTTAETCGPCHEDAACIHGCKGSSPMKVYGDVGSYQNPELILRIMEKGNYSQAQAEELFEKTKQFLALSGNGTRKSPTKEVDLAWHEFILFTRDYAQFCEKYFGTFIHHIPTPRLAGRKPSEVRASADCQSEGDGDSGGDPSECGTSACSPSSNCSSDQTGGEGEDCSAES
jgi:hypothetical protein